MELLAVIPTLSFVMEPVLAHLDQWLDDDVLFPHVNADLRRRAPHTARRGRPSTPVEVILRMLVVKRLYGWSYEATERLVADSLVLRQCCRVDLEPVPADTTWRRWATLIASETLTALNERVVGLARLLKVTQGRKLRVDHMVVETTLHHPTDSGLLGDGGRVLSRWLRRAKTIVGQGPGLGPRACRRRVRRVRRLLRQLHRLARHKGAEATAALQRAYGRWLTVAKQTPTPATQVCARRRQQTTPKAQPLVRQFEPFLPRMAHVIDQTVRRIMHREVVPARDKLVSRFEPHTQIIVRRKTGKAVECGRKVWLEEVEGGLISGYRILTEAGQDFPSLPARLTAHRQRFGRPPRWLTADRGVYSAANEAAAQQARDKQIVIPYAGKAPPARVAQERAAWFRRGLRFRAGIEGRISVLRRRFELARCRDHGEAGLGRWVGWGIVTANLRPIAHKLAARPVQQTVKAA